MRLTTCTFALTLSLATALAGCESGGPSRSPTHVTKPTPVDQTDEHRFSLFSEALEDIGRLDGSIALDKSQRVGAMRVSVPAGGGRYGQQQGALTKIDPSDVWGFVQSGVIIVLDPMSGDLIDYASLTPGADRALTLDQAIYYNAMEYPDVLVGVALFDGTSSYPVAAGFELAHLAPGYAYDQPVDLVVDVNIFLVKLEVITVD